MIAAALHLFRERGFTASSVRDVAAAAGVTSGALYRHFPSKQALAGALFADCAGRLAQALEAARAESSDPADALARTVAALLEFSRREPDAYGFLLERHLEEVGREYHPPRLPLEVFAQVISDGVAQGAFPPQEAVLSAALVVGMCQRAVFVYDRGLTRATWPDLMARLTQAALAVVGTAAVSPVPWEGDLSHGDRITPDRED